jgi:hypothetical protein
MVAFLFARVPLISLSCCAVGLSCCFVTVVMARRDTARMTAGLVDPWGKPMTRSAREMARFGTLCNLAGLVIWGTVLAVMMLLDL